MTERTMFVFPANAPAAPASVDAALAGKRAGETHPTGWWLFWALVLPTCWVPLIPLISHAIRKPEPRVLTPGLPEQDYARYCDAYGDAAKRKRNRAAWLGYGIGVAIGIGAWALLSTLEELGTQGLLR